MRRVAITGQGTINALGHNVATTLAAFAAGRGGIGPMDFPNLDRLTVKIGAQIKGFTPQDHFTRQQMGLYDPFTQYAVIAAQEAIAESGIMFDGELSETSGVIMGTAGGGLQTQDENFRSVYEDGKNRVHPFVVPRLMSNAAASHISMNHGLKGPTYSVTTACASSNHAIGQAAQTIRSGAADVMVTGGSESMLSFGGIKAWEGLRVMSEDGCRPFCKTRNGLVQGEGAAVFVLEEWEHAHRRGANILAELAGFSMTSDASDIVLPNGAGAERAMKLAMKDASLTGSDIGYVNAHGTGTRVNDKVECNVIKTVFGVDAGDLMVSSTKSMHGHAIGATGAIELIACIAALQDGLIAPTIGWQEQDPDCDLDVVPNNARQAKISACLSNAFAFGGLNAVLALKAV